MTEDFQERANEQGDIVVPNVGVFERALKDALTAKARKEAQAPKPEQEVEDK